MAPWEFFFFLARRVERKRKRELTGAAAMAAEAEAAALPQLQLQLLSLVSEHRLLRVSFACRSSNALSDLPLPLVVLIPLPFYGFAGAGACGARGAPRRQPGLSLSYSTDCDWILCLLGIRVLGRIC